MIIITMEKTKKKYPASAILAGERLLEAASESEAKRLDDAIAKELGL